MQENKIEDAVREYTQMVLNIAYTYTWIRELSLKLKPDEIIR